MDYLTAAALAALIIAIALNVVWLSRKNSMADFKKIDTNLVFVFEGKEYTMKNIVARGFNPDSITVKLVKNEEN